jgi:hypothetical protein
VNKTVLAKTPIIPVIYRTADPAHVVCGGQQLPHNLTITFESDLFSRAEDADIAIRIRARRDAQQSDASGP